MNIKIQISHGREFIKDDKAIAIRVEHADKSFTVYYDRVNTLKERLLFYLEIKNGKETNTE